MSARHSPFQNNNNFILAKIHLTLHTLKRYSTTVVMLEWTLLPVAGKWRNKQKVRMSIVHQAWKSCACNSPFMPLLVNKFLDKKCTFQSNIMLWTGFQTFDSETVLTIFFELSTFLGWLISVWSLFSKFHFKIAIRLLPICNWHYPSQLDLTIFVMEKHPWIL